MTRGDRLAATLGALVVDAGQAGDVGRRWLGLRLFAATELNVQPAS